jgi:SAM-dependent methyltransferase
MEPGEYRRMFETEDRLWWYRGLRLHLERAFGDLPPGALVLDAGCGTGANLVLLSRRFARAVGCDLSAEAAALSASRGLRRVVVADLNALPFRAGAFDAVLSSDVIECQEVDERQAVGELARVTRVGGRLVLSVPAYAFLLSEHDRAVHSIRRYTRGRAATVLEGGGLRIVEVRYVFGALFLPIVAYRLLRRWWPRRGPARPVRSDVFLPPAFVNSTLLAIVRLEARAAKLVRLPFGTTLLVTADRV